MGKITINKRLLTAFCASSISMTLLTSCNQTILDTKYTFNKAIIFSENSATIVDVKQWKDYDDGEQIQIITSDDLVILTSSYDTKLINDEESDITAEDVAYAIGGSNIEINYLGSNSKTK